MAEPKLNAGYPGTVLGLGRPPGGEWLPTPVFLPEEFHGQWSLVGYSPWGCKESDMIERITQHNAHSGRERRLGKGKLRLLIWL